VEATPIVVDGVIYATGPWSHVLALDAKTGKLLWEFDPQVSGAYGAKGCCDIVNRGVAVWAGKVYVGAFDGRLIALEAKSGNKVWETLTVDQTKDYTITGAPRIVKGKVLIGNGGADFGVRGYVSAYDADNGKMLWRFYTVPGNPADGFETKTVETIAKSWSGAWWKHGGGGTVWDSMAYDPALDLLSISVSATAVRGITRCGATARATISSCRRSLRCAPTPASTSGTSRRRRPRTGTTPRRST